MNKAATYEPYRKALMRKRQGEDISNFVTGNDTERFGAYEAGYCDGEEAWACVPSGGPEQTMPADIDL